MNNGAGLVLIIIVLAVLASAFALVVAVLGYIFMALMALSSFIAFSWSFACLFAWRNHLHLGKLFIHREDARAFIIRGIFGAIMLPFFLGLADLFTELPVRWDLWFYFALSGYTFFSVGFEYLVASKRDVPYVHRDALPIIYQAPQQPTLPPPRPRLPRYASWDDDEEIQR